MFLASPLHAQKGESSVPSYVLMSQQAPKKNDDFVIANNGKFYTSQRVHNKNADSLIKIGLMKHRVKMSFLQQL